MKKTVMQKNWVRKGGAFVVAFLQVMVLFQVQLPKAAALEMSGIGISYDLKAGKDAYAGSDIRNMTYEDTNGVWEMAGYAPTLDTYNRTMRNNQSYGIQNAAMAGDWTSLRIYVPASGRYAFKVQHPLLTNGRTANVYFAPDEGTTSADWHKPEYYKGELDFLGAEFVRNYTTELGFVDVDAPGDYIVTVESNPTNGQAYYLGGFILDGGAGGGHLAAAGVEATYDLEAGMNTYPDSDCRTITYADTENVWEMAGYDPEFDSLSNPTTRIRNNQNCLAIGATAVGQWVSVRVPVAVPGRYKISLEYRTYANSALANIYVAPPRESLSERWRDERYLLNEVDFRNETNETVIETVNRDFGWFDFDELGDYIVTFEVKYTEDDYGEGLIPRIHHTMRPRKIILNGIGLSNLEVTLPGKQMQVGQTGFVAASGKNTDDTDADLEDGEVTYVSSSPEVATVNASTGEINAVSVGTTNITVSATINGFTASRTESLMVMPVKHTATAGQILVNADGAAPIDAITVTGVDYSDFGSGKSFGVGSSVTVSAQSSVGDKTFLYWKNSASKRIVSTDAEYTFKVGTNTSVTAIYRDTSEGYLVEFFDKNGKVLLTTHLNEGNPSVVAPEPYSVGYEFINWKSGDEYIEAGATVDQSTVAGSQALFVAQYSAEDTTYTVEVDDGENAPYTDSYTYNTMVTVNAGDFPDGQEFAYWTRDEGIVSYSEEYSFYVWDNTKLTAVSKATSDVLTPVPSIIMDKSKCVEDTATGTYRAIFLAERTLPAGYELIETGILISTSVAEPTIETAGVYKAAAHTVSANGQFTVRKDGVETGTTCYARAYMIYKTSGGDYELIYSNSVSRAV